MLRHGSPIWTLCLFGAITIPAGFGLWHGPGPHVGLGPTHAPVRPVVAYVCPGFAAALLALGFVVGGE